MEKLDSEMNRFHSNKLVQSTDGLEKGRLHSKRRKTILRETDIFDILTKYEGLSQTTKIAHLQFHLLEIGTLIKASLSPEYFDCLPALTEIEIVAEQNDPSKRIFRIITRSILQTANLSCPYLVIQLRQWVKQC